MAALDSRSVPHMYTMMVVVSVPSPLIAVYFGRAVSETFVFSTPLLEPKVQPVL